MRNNYQQTSENNINKKELPSIVWRIYTYMKTYCVGKKNAKTAEKIIWEMQLLITKRTFRRYVNMLRKSGVITREIGSNSIDGYWLTTSKDEKGLTYVAHQGASNVITAVKAGVPVEYFYAVLNGIENGTIVDQNQRLPLTDYQNTEVKKYSDDLVTV